MTTVLTVPAPGKFMNANHRLDRWTKADLTKTWRTAACLYARQAKLPSYGETQVRIFAHVHLKTARSYDAGNYYPTAKACVDGLRDAGVLVEDSNRYVIGPDMREGEKRAQGPCLVLRIEAV